MLVTGEGRIRNTRARILGSATWWLFAMITALRNSQELEDRRIFEIHLNEDQNVPDGGKRSQLADSTCEAQKSI
jgi:hypothetical protein